MACSHVDYRLEIDFLRPYLERVRHIDVGDVLRRVKEGSMQAFTAGPASVIVSAMDFSGTVWIYAAAGVLKDLLPALDELEMWYYYRGGELIYIPGREGWIRVLKSRGYEVVDGRLVKELSQWVAIRAETMRLQILT